MHDRRRIVVNSPHTLFPMPRPAEPVHYFGVDILYVAAEALVVLVHEEGVDAVVRNGGAGVDVHHLRDFVAQAVHHFHPHQRAGRVEVEDDEDEFLPLRHAPPSGGMRPVRQDFAEPSVNHRYQFKVGEQRSGELALPCHAAALLLADGFQFRYF